MRAQLLPSQLLTLLSVVAIVTIGSSRVEATSLSGKLTADNLFVAALSTDDSVFGTEIASGNNFGLQYSFNQALVPGTTYFLHIIGVNQDGNPHNPESGNPDGMIGWFTLSDANFAFTNNTQALGTEATTNWRSQILNDGWVTPVGTPIFRLSNGGLGYGWPGFPDMQTADWIWGAPPENVGRAIFSTTIVPLTAAVPVPPAIMLFASGLAALGLLQRRRKKQAA
jgi:hypothetical protein